MSKGDEAADGGRKRAAKERTHARKRGEWGVGDARGSAHTAASRRRGHLAQPEQGLAFILVDAPAETPALGQLILRTRCTRVPCQHAARTGDTLEHQAARLRRRFWPDARGGEKGAAEGRCCLLQGAAGQIGLMRAVEGTARRR